MLHWVAVFNKLLSEVCCSTTRSSKNHHFGWTWRTEFFYWKRKHRGCFLRCRAGELARTGLCAQVSVVDPVFRVTSLNFSERWKTANSKLFLTTTLPGMCTQRSRLSKMFHFICVCELWLQANFSGRARGIWASFYRCFKTKLKNKWNTFNFHCRCVFVDGESQD